MDLNCLIIGLVFIEVWKEILYVNTPSFYQSKMINTMSGAEELVEAIDDYIQDDKSKKSLLSMIEDYKGNLKKDSIAKDTFKNLHATLLKKLRLFLTQYLVIIF